jgi:hypothetical protein
MSFLPCYYLYVSFIYYTCWVPTISVLNLAIFPCYSNLLLRRRRWTRILQWGVQGYVLPRLPFLWCKVFRCSVLVRVILVFKGIIYVRILLYICDIWLLVSTFGCMCGAIDIGSCIRWVLDFGIKLGMTVSLFTHVRTWAGSPWTPSSSPSRATAAPGSPQFATVTAPSTWCRRPRMSRWTLTEFGLRAAACMPQGTSTGASATPAACSGSMLAH